MPTMIPSIPSSAPKSDKIIFNSIIKSGHTSEWVVFYRQEERPRFVICIAKHCSVICLDAEGGHYQSREGKWYYNADNSPIPFQRNLKAVSDLEDRFSAHFSGLPKATDSSSRTAGPWDAALQHWNYESKGGRFWEDGGSHVPKCLGT